MNFSLLVKWGPRILVCGLSFSVISTYYSFICDYARSNLEFACGLKLFVNLTIQGKQITIKPENITDLPVMKKHISANTEYYEEIEGDEELMRASVKTKATLANVAGASVAKAAAGASVKKAAAGASVKKNVALASFAGASVTIAAAGANVNKNVALTSVADDDELDEQIERLAQLSATCIKVE
jgi:hypothetical protein